MLLSEAIRIGAQKRPQTSILYIRDGGSCALGAAIETVAGYIPEESETGNKILREHFGSLSDMKVVCPEGCPWTACTETLRGVIVHLNDEHKWTREAIADHIASLGY